LAVLESVNLAASATPCSTLHSQILVKNCFRSCKAAAAAVLAALAATAAAATAGGRKALRQLGLELARRAASVAVNSQTSVLLTPGQK